MASAHDGGRQPGVDSSSSPRHGHSSPDFYSLLEQMEHLKYALLAQHQSDMKALTQGLQKASMSKASDQSLAAARVGGSGDACPKVPQLPGDEVSSKKRDISPTRSLEVGRTSDEDVWSVSDLDYDSDLYDGEGPLVLVHTIEANKMGSMQSGGTSSGRSLTHAIGARRHSMRSDGRESLNNETRRSRFQPRDSWQKLKEGLKDQIVEDEVPHPFAGGMTSRRMSDAYLMLPSMVLQCLQHLVISPNSKRGALWNLLRILVVIFDVVLVPLVTFLPVSGVDSRVEFGLCCFWTLDMAASAVMATFVNGVLVMHPGQIAQRYLRVWAAFDFALLAMQWTEFLLLMTLTVSDDSQVARVLYGLRFFRLLRMLKAKDRVLGAIVIFLPRGFALLDVAPLILLLPFLIHLLACVWCGLGDADDGWVHTNGYDTKPALEKYLVALHWVSMALHGTLNVFPTTKREYIFSSVVAVCSMILMAWLFGHAVQVISSMSNLEYTRIHEYCRRYLQSRRVSTELVVKLNQWFQNQKSRGFNESLEETVNLYACLPDSLQRTLAQEVRGPIINVHPYFNQLKTTATGQGALKHLCHQAVSVTWAAPQERVYNWGDQCESMFFVETGQFLYIEPLQDATQQERAQTDFARLVSPSGYNHHGGAVSRSIGVGKMKSAVSALQHQQLYKGAIVASSSQERPVDKTSGLSGRLPTDHTEWSMHEMAVSASTSVASSVRMLKGSWLCEPALWTKWRNRGTLVGVDGGSLLTVIESEFLKVLGSQDGAGNYTVAYLKHFLWHLNHTPKKALSDLIQFDISLDDIVNMSGGYRPDEHLIFLSHFKQEAGTEAALIQESLERMVRNDITHPASEFFSPVFLDSEDLNDLRTLATHVRKSHNMVVLLTDQILMRPWCIMEMVIAMRHGVCLHPVEINKPGVGFTYPTEETYTKIRTGVIFGPEELLMLRGEGVELIEVEEAIRELFHRIAMTFSPHKSTKMRNAELQDILTRCQLGRQRKDNSGPISYQTSGP